MVAKMDERDRRICALIWRRWADGKSPPSLRELMAYAGIPTTSVVNRRIWGHRRKGGGLIKRGWIRDADGRAYSARTLIPGPRFAALDSDGTPLERVDGQGGLL